MSHTNGTATNDRTCVYAVEGSPSEFCVERAHVLVALNSGQQFWLCVDHSALLIDSVNDDEIDDVCDVRPDSELSRHRPNVVQSLQCVGYELLIEYSARRYAVRPSYATDALCSFDTYRDAMTFAVEQNVDEFENEVQL